MREIKFRAWDKVTLKMCPVWSIHWKAWDINPNQINFVDIEIDGTIERLEHEIELMQFTGLRDKHGKEIYEGDLILWVGYSYVTPLKVKFGPYIGNAGLQCSGVGFYLFYGEVSGGADKGYPMWPGEKDLMKIIGNIHEHPHLLEPDNAKVES